MHVYVLICGISISAVIRIILVSSSILLILLPILFFRKEKDDTKDSATRTKPCDKSHSSSSSTKKRKIERHRSNLSVQQSNHSTVYTQESLPVPAAYTDVTVIDTTSSYDNTDHTVVTGGLVTATNDTAEHITSLDNHTVVSREIDSDAAETLETTINLVTLTADGSMMIETGLACSEVSQSDLMGLGGL